MAFDPVLNFAIGEVLTAPSPAGSGTTLVLKSGQGARFPQPSTDGSFNVTVHPKGEYPTPTNSEIVRVTARTTDTLTIDREEEGTSARTIQVDDLVILSMTKYTVEMMQDHDQLDNFVANEHIDWTSTSSNIDTSGTISGGNITLTGSALEHDASTAADWTIENKDQDKDIIFKVNDGGSSTEVFRAVGADSQLVFPNSTQGYIEWKNSTGTAYPVLGVGATDAVIIKSVLDASTASSIIHHVFDDSTGDNLVEIGSSTAYNSIVMAVGGNSKPGALAAYNTSNAYAITSSHDGTNGILASTSGHLILDAATVYINDTSNANMGAGLTINQGALDDVILALKSSDVAHGMTDYTETDSYANFSKVSAEQGGLAIDTYCEGSDSLHIRVHETTNETGAKSTSSSGTMEIHAYKKNGTSRTTCDADTNMLIIADGASTRFVFDSDGNSHQDVGTAWTNFDEHDDIELLTKLSVSVSKENDVIRKGFGAVLSEEKEKLEKLKLVSYNDDTDGHAFVNMSKLTMLLVGAVRQQSQKIKQLEDKLLLGA